MKTMKIMKTMKPLFKTMFSIRSITARMKLFDTTLRIYLNLLTRFSHQ